MQKERSIVTMNPSPDQHGFRQELSLAPAPAAPVQRAAHSDVYLYTMLLAAGLAAGASEDGDPAVVTVPALQKIKETVSEVEVAPGITVGDLALAAYKFITTEIPPIDDHEQLLQD